MSKYLDEIKDLRTGSSIYTIGYVDHTGQVHKTAQNQVTRTTTVGYDIQEEVYKDFTLVTETVEREWEYLVNEDGSIMTGNYYTKDSVTMERGKGDGNKTRFKQSWSYAWKTGTELPADLKYYNNNSTFWRLFPADSAVKSIKKAKVRLDLESLGEAQRELITKLVNDRLYDHQAVEPYNVKINDLVWVQSLAKLRQGVVVQTQGRKFVVAYSVPSNRTLIRYKSLPLSSLRVQKDLLNTNQKHNFQKVGD